jgi:hypothetical protein
MTTLSVSRWDWTDEDGPARLLRELTERGIARIRFPEAAVESNDVRRLFDRLFGPSRSLLRTARLVVSPRPGEVAIVGSDVEGPPHIDDDEFMPAHVQILCCVKPAARGGESFYVDSWMVLEQISTEDPELFEALFNELRVFRYNGATPLRPTISLRYGNVICSHAPVPDDEIGERFQRYVDRAPRYEFLAEPGDICVINHQRLLHGRRAFEGSREFVRILYWLATPFEAPRAFVARAQRFASYLGKVVPESPVWAREWLVPRQTSTAGVGRLAAVLAYVAGEDYEQVCQRHGVRPQELFQWTARVLAVSAASLGEADVAADRSRDVAQQLAVSAVEALCHPQTVADTRQEANVTSPR